MGKWEPDMELSICLPCETWEGAPAGEGRPHVLCKWRKRKCRHPFGNKETDWLCNPVQSAMPGRMTWHTRAGGGDQVGSRSPGSHGKFETQQGCCPLLVSFHFSHLLTTPCGHRWGQIRDEGRDWWHIRKIHCSGVGGLA